MDGKPGVSWSPAHQQQQPNANGAAMAAQASLSMPQGNGQVGHGANGAADASQNATDAAGKNGLTVAGSGIVPVLQ